MRTSILLLMVAIAAPSADCASTRDRALDDALAHWDLGADSPAFAHPLNPVGRIERRATSDGGGAIPGEPVSHLDAAYYDAGRALGVDGTAITIYLRARDPEGRWDYGLVAKRGNTGIMNYNLFSLAGTIGIEQTTERGLASTTFPMSAVDTRAWHDIVARYDGETIDLFCDGMRMSRRLWKGGALRQNEEPTLIGAETGGSVPGASIPVRPFSGEMQEAAIWKRALTDSEIAALMRRKAIVDGPGYLEPNSYLSPLHYRPGTSVLADTIPFYWKGAYHVFYLHPEAGVNWNHIVTRDFLNWTELPVALRPDGAPDGPDGLFMFTGSVVEKDGVFHCFYTGHNPANPEGLEFILHATSTDLITWAKHPEDILRPDGTIYRIGTKSGERWVPSEWNFRDPYVFLNEDEGLYWMLFLGDDARTGKMVQGLAVSRDLREWELREPLDAPVVQECPDLFRIGDTWHLIGGHQHLWARSPQGPYREPEISFIDSPFIYAGKRMFDGKRHIWTGWLRDRSPQRDDGAMQWGGTQCLPRELYPGPDGALYCRPVREVLTHFTRTALDLKSGPRFSDNSSKWTVTTSGLSGKKDAPGSQCTFDVPANYMMECSLRMGASSVVEVTFRENGLNGYRLVLDPARGQASLKGTSFSVDRKVRLDTRRPVRVRAFVLGTMLEVFVDDRYALSCRAYDYPSGKLGLNILNGKVDLTGLKVKTP